MIKVKMGKNDGRNLGELHMGLSEQVDDIKWDSG